MQKKRRTSRAVQQGPESLRDRLILARWFLEYRLLEEVERARRYERPMAVIAATPAVLHGERPSSTVIEAVVDAATRVTRTTDLIGWADDDRILIVMPETTSADARAATSRWQSEIWQRIRALGGQQWKLAALNDPEDFGTLETLYQTLTAKPDGALVTRGVSAAAEARPEEESTVKSGAAIVSSHECLTSRRRTAALLAALGGSIAAASLAVLAQPTIAASFAAATAILVAAALSPAREARRPSADGQMVEKAIEHAASGRRLVIYERETGLLAYWYLTLRGEEECARAARYGRSLALMLVEPSDAGTAWSTKESLATWLRRQLRAADVVGYVGNARFVVLMPETNGTALAQTVARLRVDVPAIDLGAAYHPGDGVTFQQLYEIASRRLTNERDLAA